MGEIAEDMMDGSCCELCGQYFEHSKKKKNGEPIGIYVHGYPATCWECWEDLNEHEKKGRSKSDVKTF
jgi:hypothetical protein